MKCCFVLAMAAISVCAAAAQQARPVDDKALKNAAKSEEWLTNGHDLGDNRYSPLKQIDTTNASRLGLAWYYDTNDSPGTVETTPIVVNGKMYGTGTWGLVYALDARTGKELWTWDPKVGHQNFPSGSSGKPDRQRTGPSMCCGPANRGVAFYEGKVIVGTPDAHLIAFDAETGKILWDTPTAEKDSDYSITGAPIIAKGKVIIGNAGGEYAVRGYVSAYDATTGKLAWRFYTVPGDPSKPFENKAMEMAAKTWTGNEWWKIGGGGNAWDGISYDPDLDLVYFGTGQGGPWVIKYRSTGDNLFVCSIIAVRAETGEYVWHFQTTPGDEWDYDAVPGLTLADIKIDGKMRKVIMQAPKNGFFYVLDRKTGEFISGKPYVKVTWATGLDPKTGRPIEAPNMHYDDKTVVASPGPAGGHVWQGMSYNPATGLVYLPALDSDFNYTSAPTFKYELGTYNWGIVFRPPPPPRPGEPAVLPTPPGGSLVAWDPVTQTERWRLKQMNGGGTVSTAGGVLFAESSDGQFKALSADKGEELWSVKLLAGMGNPATYMLDGKQYVSVLSGRQGKSRIYTFALDSKEPIPDPPNAAPPPPPPAGTAPAAPTQQNQQ